VSSFLTAHQLKIGCAVPYTMKRTMQVKSKKHIKYDINKTKITHPTDNKLAHTQTDKWMEWLQSV